MEEIRSGGGAINNAFGPLRKESSVVVGVKVGEEVRDGETGVGVFEAVYDETGSGNEFGVGNGGGGRANGGSGWWLWWQRQGGEGGAMEGGGC